MPNNSVTHTDSSQHRPPERLPLVWVLLGEGAGGNAQMLQLAEALGWPYLAKQMRYNLLNHLPNPLLGASVVTVDKRHSDSLDPPWPDLVIAASRRSAPVARWIKKRLGGRTRLVHLLHTQAPLHHFDLVVTLPQYRLPQRANILHNTLPLNVPDPAELRLAAEAWQPKLQHLPKPWTVVLVGGDSSSYRLDAAVARHLAARASTIAQETGGSLLISTSPRTAAAAADIIEAEISRPFYLYRWQRGGAGNPYKAFLALADRFLVTADSASLPAEACAMGQPVELFSWQPRRQPRSYDRGSLAQRLQNALIYWGFSKPRRDFAAFHQALESQGLIGGAPPASPPNDLQHTVERIRDLFKVPPV